MSSKHLSEKYEHNPQPRERRGRKASLLMTHRCTLVTSRAHPLARGDRVPRKVRTKAQGCSEPGTQKWK